MHVGGVDVGPLRWESNGRDIGVTVLMLLQNIEANELQN